MAARVKPLAIGAARPKQTNNGFVRFLIHRNFFDEGVAPSKRRCRDRWGSGERRNCQGVRAKNAPGRLAFNHLGFQTEGSGNGGGNAYA